MEELRCNRAHVTELLIMRFRELRGLAEIIVAATQCGSLRISFSPKHQITYFF